MKFFLDTADRNEAVPLLRTGLFAGLTTNPTLLARAGIPNGGVPDLVNWATAAGAGTVFVQAWGSTADELEDRGRWISALGDRLVVKIPATAAGLEATARLASTGVPVLVTAVYSRVQALPAMAAGARYIAPYLGRMNDAGRDGLAEIAAMQDGISAADSGMEVLVASLRDPGQASELSRAGVTNFTLGAAVWAQFFSDPLTTQAVEQFERDSAGAALAD